MSVAKTILNQIKMLDRAAMWAWGAKELVNIGNGLRFKTTGMTPWKGYVQIKYNEGTDLYDLDFYQIRKFEVKTFKKFDGIFAEDLVNIIDSIVG